MSYCGNNLHDKLEESVSPGSIAGTISKYFCHRYGFSPECSVSSFTGDNQASVSSIPIAGGDLLISLGTSDTACFVSSTPRTNPSGHVFAHPNEPGKYMNLLCFRNGSLMREDVKNRDCNGSWQEFNENLLKKVSPKVGFYYKDPEIIPKAHGIFLFDGTTQVGSFPSSSHPRLLIESQFMSMRIFIANLGFTPKRVIATGGASKNPAILKILCNVFGVDVFGLDADNSASLGCAYRAKYSVSGDKYLSFEDMLKDLHEGLVLRCEPELIESDRYTSDVPRFTQLSNRVCGMGRN
jgi:xylulokinase